MGVVPVAAVRAQIASGAADPVYLIVGEDDVEKSALASEFADLVDDGLRAFNVERIHAGDYTTGDKLLDGVGGIVAAARTLPMMVPRRGGIVLQAGLLLTPRRERDAGGRGLGRVHGMVKQPQAETKRGVGAAAGDRR